MKCNLVGYCENRKAYRLWDPSSKIVRASRDVTFNESSTYAKDDLEETEFREGVCTAVGEGGGGTATVVPPDGRATESNAVQFPEERPNAGEQDEPFHGFEESETSGDVRREVMPKRQARKPQRLIEDESFGKIAQDAKTHDEKEPLNYQEAIDSPEGGFWELAMDEEIESLQKNETWSLVTLPPGRKTVKCKWIYKKKRDADGDTVRYKARLVAQGYSQRKGIDFKETYAPVARLESLRTLLSLAAVNDMEIVQLDVRTAFLNGTLNKDIYMNQPEGYIDEKQPQAVCKLLKSLYGLKQASRAWNLKFHSVLCDLGFKRSESDPCVYRQEIDGKVSVLAIWVDDGLLCCDSRRSIMEMVAALKSQLEISVC